MKMFYILCVLQVVSAAPNIGVTKEELHDYPEVRDLLAKQTGAHDLDKRLLVDTVLDTIGSALDTVVDFTAGVVSDVAEGVVGGVKSVAKHVGKAADVVVDGVKSFAEHVGRSAKDVEGDVGGINENVGQAVTSGSRKKSLQNLGEAADSAVGGVVNGVEHGSRLSEVLKLH